MNTRNRSLAVMLVATALVVGFPHSKARASSVTLHVQATIRPYLRFSATQPVGSYRVTEAAIRRGYVDLPRALTLHYQSNIPDALHFEVANAGPEQVLVDGAAGAVLLAKAEPGVLMVRDLDLRVVLPPQATEGIYPLQVTLMPVAY